MGALLAALFYRFIKTLEYEVSLSTSPGMRVCWLTKLGTDGESRS